ncbi:hypothetical protein EH31_11730 [Erythrobacter longus]|uniref:Uncharacterized protein n=1 Tax=Erythrobacter longus TaxID=1044 RepID=A0A074MAN2_ERYLO|nr:hypothetical protein EH31_11730 [Erythrobacter longus]
MDTGKHSEGRKSGPDHPSTFRAYSHPQIPILRQAKSLLQVADTQRSNQLNTKAVFDPEQGADTFKPVSYASPEAENACIFHYTLPCVKPI